MKERNKLNVILQYPIKEEGINPIMAIPGLLVRNEKLYQLWYQLPKCNL